MKEELAAAKDQEWTAPTQPPVQNNDTADEPIFSLQQTGQVLEPTALDIPASATSKTANESGEAN